MNIAFTTKYHMIYRVRSVLAFLLVLGLGACTSSRKAADTTTTTPRDLSLAVLFHYGQDQVMANDFSYVFLKNNQDSIQGISTSELESSVRDYLKLYINFKLKVEAAYEAGMDREPAFVKEFTQYREQLAKPYMVENRYKESMIQEAYERMSEEIHASHILISVPEGSEDTLVYYRKADSLRRLAEEGASFAMLAEQHSEDPSAPQNGGNLGFFSALQMVYPFESAAYQTPVGKISSPVRTQFGYHIIKVHEKRSAQGSVKVAHIMIRHEEGEPQDETSAAYVQAMDIYDELQAGGDWAELTERFSEDVSTRSSGGELPYFSTGGMLKEFEEAAFSLKKEGDITRPVKTRYGWHIIRLVDRKGLAPLEEVRPLIERKVQRILQLSEMQDDMVRMLKEENQYMPQEENIQQALLYIQAAPEVLQPTAELQLFSLKDTTFTFGGFAEYLGNQKISTPLDSVVAKRYYREFEEKMILDNEESHLTDKYPDFRRLLQEYKEGILLFNIMERRVWNQANEDTQGLNSYYNQHKSRYQWKQRVKATLLEANDPEVLKQLQARADILNTDTETLKNLVQEINEENRLSLQQYTGTYEKGVERKQAESVIDQVTWEEGSYEASQNGLYYLILIHEVLDAEPKDLEEVKGLVIADYQRKLDEEWVQELHERYPVKVDELVLKQLIEQLEHEKN